MQVLPLVGALACVLGLMALEGHRPAHPLERGLYFALTTECPANVDDDRRIEVVGLAGDHTTYLNDEPISRSALRAEIALRMKTRNDAIVYIRGDNGTTYGDFVSLASDFVADTPTIMLALATTSQAGPVNPSGRKAFWKQYRWNQPIPRQMQFGYCLPRETWNLTAKGFRPGT